MLIQTLFLTTLFNIVTCSKIFKHLQITTTGVECYIINETNPVSDNFTFAECEEFRNNFTVESLLKNGFQRLGHNTVCNDVYLVQGDTGSAEKHSLCVQFYHIWFDNWGILKSPFKTLTNCHANEGRCDTKRGGLLLWDNEIFNSCNDELGTKDCQYGTYNSEENSDGRKFLNEIETKNICLVNICKNTFDVFHTEKDFFNEDHPFSAVFVTTNSDKNKYGCFTYGAIGINNYRHLDLLPPCVNVCRYSQGFFGEFKIPICSVKVKKNFKPTTEKASLCKPTTHEHANLMILLGWADYHHSLLC